MRTPLCTLFGFNYLDKGLVLYESLARVASDFVLYVLAMDDDCYDFLLKGKYKYLIPIRLSDFENEDLLIAKENRSFGEYCWSCSSSLIKFVLDSYQEHACAYIDADMYFYSDPVVLFEELEDRKGSVLLTGHRFNSCDRDMVDVVGKYCVEFNLFLNRPDARMALDAWIRQSLDNCSSTFNNVTFGDQKYLDDWHEKYDFVRETYNLGAGVAPWNISQYKLVLHNNDTDRYLLKTDVGEYELVFYHFQGLKYLDRHQVDIGLYNYWGIDDFFAQPLYADYLRRVEKQKSDIFQDTGREILIKTHPAFRPRHRSLLERFHSIVRKLFSIKGLQLTIGKEIPQRLFAKKNIVSI